MVLIAVQIISSVHTVVCMGFYIITDSNYFLGATTALFSLN